LWTKWLKLTQLAQCTLPVGRLRVNSIDTAKHVVPTVEMKTYRKDAHFLPYINNEVPGHQNSSYTQNFKSLEKLVLVMAEDDSMVHPKESEHFGYFKDGSDKELISMKSAPWYTEDWFGLRSLDEAQKIDFYSTPGNHLRFTMDFLQKMVTKYFAAQAQDTVIHV